MNKLADRIIHVLDSLLNLAVYIVVIVLLFISGYSLLDNYRLHQQASDDSLLVYKPVLDEQSKDPAESISLDGQVGWLCVENTYIDYPLMQGILFVTTAIMAASIVVTDLICLVLDPRQRKGEHYA